MGINVIENLRKGRLSFAESSLDCRIGAGWGHLRSIAIGREETLRPAT
jgi:hypothetical protein